jgi:hypothetical protein
MMLNGFIVVSRLCEFCFYCTFRLQDLRLPLSLQDELEDSANVDPDLRRLRCIVDSYVLNINYLNAELSEAKT